jgi:N-acetylglucosaminyldiphosphoundecaprenol N-acetyl-beta-D-mannosaminyltransferase
MGRHPIRESRRLKAVVAVRLQSPFFAPNHVSVEKRDRAREAVVTVAVQQGPTSSSRPHGDERPIAPDFSRSVYCVQGLICDAVTMEQATQKIIASIKERRRCNIATPNANFLRMIRSDREFRDAVLASDLSVIDGMPLVWFARTLGIAVPHRVCGSDLFDALMRRTSDRISAFFFGATDDVGRCVRERLDENTSGVRCAGVYSPGFGTVEAMSDPGIFDIINQASPDLLAVSVGARKGLLWLNRNEHLLSSPVICNLGATIHFVAGSVKRAPVFFQHHGLEWLWRIKEEPALWRRYALDLTTLISVLVGQILPCLVNQALHEPSAKQPSARLQHYHDGTAEVLKFSGAWTKDSLAPARSALAAATRRASNLAFDFEDVTFVDAAFLGLVLIAYGYQRRIQRGFFLRASSRQVRSMMRAHGCGFLLSAGRTRPEANPIPWSVSANSPGVRKLWPTIAIGGGFWSKFRQH